MFFLIIFIPFASGLTCLIFGRFLGEKGTSFFLCFWIFFCVFLSWIALIEVGFCGSFNHFIIFSWFSSYDISLLFNFIFDPVSVFLIAIVNTISTLIHFYSISYIEKDPHKIRFLAYLSIFSFFMILLGASNNLLQLFIGWEGVGLASYLLINFWYTRLNANKSAIKALIINRIGDFSLLLGIFTIFYIFRSLNFFVIFSITPYFKTAFFYFFYKLYSSLNLIVFLLFIGACSKSAQFGFHTWLKDAMEGPTPVSALLHSSTMVVAGVFLLIRFSPLLENASISLSIIVLFGAFTSIFAATSGIFQNDLKKIIAFSTCSQLGYMFFSCGISNYELSFFHLFNHSWFKALLFLSAGVIIHSLNNEQDIRKMGGFVQLLPLTYALMLIGSFSLVGFPFLSGFFSKDFIIEICAITHKSSLAILDKSFVFWLSCLAVFFTSIYSFKLLFLTFLNKTSYIRVHINYIYENSFFLYFPLLILGYCSIFNGFLFKDLFIGFGTDFWGNSIYHLGNRILWIEAEKDILFQFKILPLFFSFLGFFFNFLSNYIFKSFLFSLNFFFFNYWIIFLLAKQWYFDKIYNFLLFLFLRLGYNITFKIIDKGFFETLGPQGLLLILPKWAFIICNFKIGYFLHYFFFIVLSIILTLSLIFFKIFIIIANLKYYKFLYVHVLVFISLNYRKSYLFLIIFYKLLLLKRGLNKILI
uniref:NADH dehydrogenase subunit 5 n=1 Tax=Neorhodella cyanea TaxID=131155 RepID=UPI001FCE274A|nr:NADH dehydrogenase subunit 5 [Neorhodella cyanea]UNJ18798.1 NADH dehydrogenase subunit 5 [Neorhodella cyanea]